MKPFSPAWHHATPHGVLSAIHLPDSPDPVPESVLNQLHESEREHARTLGGYRQVHFVGGRLALLAARRQVGAPAGPILPDERGTPVCADGWTVSISHKKPLAIGMIARDVLGTLGVDLEEIAPERPNIVERVLRPAEMEAIADLEGTRRWNAILLRFSTKEAIYKALDPHVRRYVGFKEAEVIPELSGRSQVTLHLEQGEGPFSVDARYAWLHGYLVTSVRIRQG